MTAIALSIAGSDSSGGAGIQADLKTFSALGVYGATALTALTAQNTLGVTAIHPVPPAFVRAQIDAVFDDLDVAAVKIGMLAERAIIEAVAAGLRERAPVPVVLDPVMVAATGARLISDDAVAALVSELFPLATLVTPNLPEAATLLGREIARTVPEMEEQATRLLGLGAHAALVKGGHGSGEESIDVFMETGGRPQRLVARRHPTRNTHGTGCTLSSAIAAFLARGEPLARATEKAKAYLTRAIAAADDLHVGKGHGPVHHFADLWERAGPAVRDPL